jgi:hypothetical protein
VIVMNEILSAAHKPHSAARAIVTDFPLTTTLRRIDAQNPRNGQWERILNALGWGEDDSFIPMSRPILFSDLAATSLPLGEVLWCCRAEPQRAAIWRRYAVWCARQVQHLMTDPRSLAALDVAERHAAGRASDEELDAAWAAAWAAARAAARDAAWDAAWDAQRQAFIQICTDGTLPGEVES